jgi:predicted CoA-substrate-specific enzyme activase
MTAPSTIIGIDIGSASIAAVEVTLESEIVASQYALHQGEIIESLRGILGQLDLSRVCGFASTSSTPPVLNVSRPYDNRVAVITAARRFYPNAGSILIVGGERYGWIQLDRDGHCRSFKFNTGCAAGTGSFLDQQARRLKLESTAALSAVARRNTGAIPKIASRCAVFAKTDLAHAQQEGYSLEEICDGLCYGLAKNIVDTVFTGEQPNGPVLLSGGVAKNQAVVKHIESMIGTEILVEEFPCGAAGAALCHLDDGVGRHPVSVTSIEGALRGKSPKKKLYHDSIELKHSVFPDFGASESSTYEAGEPSNPVEIDVYEDLQRFRGIDAYLGVDIGSTSTKAALLSTDRSVLAGFYTRTAGEPVKAVRKLCASIQDLLQSKRLEARIVGAATTGSGRKFTGGIIGADLVLDEITAHARAAYELNPAVDTIIEIGGQDSKFTTLQDGRVTFAVMNTVCAAGTGSFIEEQAEKLGCPLAEYSARTEHQRSPLSSDRCTVFMERDLNHYLADGYAVNEVLASVLRSVVENYLTKVAVPAAIGKAVAFQGATAKNRALVAAFEQRLGKPLFVSRYCHLTGAIGAALALCDQGVAGTSFKGLSLGHTDIPIRSETCELCTNHCKITVARVGAEEVGYGFLCGRDYSTPRQVSRNRSGFDLLKMRKDAFRVDGQERYREEFTIGIPAALHLHEDQPFWQKFFAALSVRTVSSEAHSDALRQGRHTARAEFCAPMTALHGHVNYLLDRSDFVFLPFYLEKRTKQKSIRRQYCYYTQYSPSLASGSGDSDQGGRVLMPLVNYLYSDFHTKVQLYRMLKDLSKGRISFFDVSAAYENALEFKQDALSRWRAVYERESATGEDVHVVLLGRPYAVLSPSMNKGIPDIFGSLGIKTFFQDMLTYRPEDVRAVQPLLAELHWLYAAQILEAAEVTARTDGAYPVLVTSFQCSPDSFVMEYFKRVMAAHRKPFLILQLDEHASNVGYETRIEAAVRSFRSHHSSATRGAPRRHSGFPAPVRQDKVTDKTLIFPNWDPISQRLVIANLKREGVDARLLSGSDTCVRKSLRHNSGQCLPLNIIAQEFIDYVDAHHLDPAQTVLWLGGSRIACNIGLYPHHIQSILREHGNGLEEASVYVGDLSLADISMKLPINTYLAFMFGGLLKKMGCKVRPYEKVAGTADAVLQKSVQLLEDAFLGRQSKKDALAQVVSWFEAIECWSESETAPRPKVALFGDLYVRDSDLMNQDLIHFIEANGGEVVTTPYSSYVKMIARPYLRKWFVEGAYLNALSSKALLASIARLEKIYYRYFQRILREPQPVYDVSPEELLSPYKILAEHTGESMDNILKVAYLKQHYPDIALFVQVSPAFCCPALVTEAMAQAIEKHTQTPVLSITYDGTGGSANDVIIPYLTYARRRVSGGGKHISLPQGISANRA